LNTVKTDSSPLLAKFLIVSGKANELLRNVQRDLRFGNLAQDGFQTYFYDYNQEQKEVQT